MFPVNDRLRSSLRRGPTEAAGHQRRTHEAVLRIAEKHLTVVEFNELVTDLDLSDVDIRIYDDAIIVMRDYRNDKSGGA
jgi:hypothetical protein